MYRKEHDVQHESGGLENSFSCNGRQALTRVLAYGSEAAEPSLCAHSLRGRPAAHPFLLSVHFSLKRSRHAKQVIGLPLL